MTGTEPENDARHILAADIGATNARFALFRAETSSEDAPPLSMLRERWLKGEEHASFADALQSVLYEGPDGAASLLPPGVAPDIAVIAPAGPILRRGADEHCRISNLFWTISGEETRRMLGIDRVLLINDFAAQAHACLTPESVDAEPVLPGRAVPEAPVAVVGAGTGLGLALLLRTPPPPGGETREARLERFRRARVLPSEGGHPEFPFVGEKEFAFARFASARAGTDRLIGDSIVTGSGLAHVFAFVTGQNLHPFEAAREARERPEVVEMFARFYGRACRNYVLSTLALGGLYVTGGMALRLPVLTHPAFAAEFHESAAQRSILKNIPVWHVRKPQAGLWGAALYGLLRLHD